MVDRNSLRKLASGSVELLLPLLLVVGLLLPDDDAWRDVVEIALVPTFGWYMWRYGLGDRPLVLLMWIPIAWIVWLGVSGLWGTPEVRDEWHIWSMAALLTAIFFIVSTTYVRVTPPRRLKWIAILLVLASGLQLAACLALYFADHGMTAGPRISGIGFFENPNRAAALATLMLLLSVYLAGGARTAVARLLLLSYAPLSVTYIFLTGSRGGLLVLASTILAYLAISSVMTRAFLAALGCLAFAALIIAVFPGLEDFVWHNLARDTHRPDIWQETWRLANERPLLGYGLKFDERILGRFVHPHNLHMSNLLYGGAVAFALGLATLCAAVFMAWSIPERRSRALALAGMVLAIVWTMPNGSVPISKPDDDWYHFWIPMALAWGLALRARERPSVQNGHASRRLSSSG